MVCYLDPDPNKEPTMTTAPNKSPLDVARDFCGKNPTALPAGRYKVVDRVDRREPSPETLTDSGTDKLLARAAAVKDTAEISNEAWANQQATEFVSNSGVLGRELDAKFLALAFERAILRGYMQGSESVLNKLGNAAATVGLDGDAATLASESGKIGPNGGRVGGPRAPAVAADLGDGLGLPLVSVGPSGVGGYAQTEIASAKPVCLTCGRTTLGSDECTDCARSRHNDDDAQGAAQARADAAELPDHND